MTLTPAVQRKCNMYAQATNSARFGLVKDDKDFRLLLKRI